MAFIPPKKVFTYFSREFDLLESSSDWWVFECPYCNEIKERKKMAVHFGYGVVKCWICGYKKSVSDFVAEYQGIDYKEAKSLLWACPDSTLDFKEISKKANKVVLSEIELPEGYTSILDGEGILGKRARNYLTGRGFDLETLDRLGIGYCPVPSKDLDTTTTSYFGYIIIPFKSKGKLVYYIGRDYIGNFERYKNPAKDTIGVGKADLLFNEDALFLYEEVYLLEGWSDAVTIGSNACSTQGWKLSANQKSIILKSPVKIITLVPDAGFDGQGVSFYLHALELAMELSTHKEVRVINMNNQEGKDVNAIGRDKFMEIQKDFKVLNEEEIMMEFLYCED